MKKYLPMLLFNIAEVGATVVLGIILKTNPITIAMILLTWIVVRLLVKEPMHYKSPVKCFAMTLFLFTSLFLATRVNLYLGILCVVFDGIVMSKYGNISDVAIGINENLTQWHAGAKERISIYQDLIDFVRDNPNNRVLMMYSDYWQGNYPRRFEIFEAFFRYRKTYDQIMLEMQFKDHTLIKQECRVIYATLEMPLKLKSVNK